MSLDINNLEESSESDSNDESADADNKVGPLGPRGKISARDMALMVEEKWLIESLKTIRQQRKKLKMERIYHRELKAKLIADHVKKFGTVPCQLPKPYPDAEISDEPIPEPIFPEYSKLINVDKPGQWMKSHDSKKKKKKKVVEEGESSHANMDVVDEDNGDKGDV